MTDNDKKTNSAKDWLRYIAATVPLPEDVLDCIRKFLLNTSELTIKELMEQSWAHAESKGFHQKEKTFAEDCALFHAEISKALEEYRQGIPLTSVYYGHELPSKKPEGVPIELADVIIRIADVCKTHGIDLEAAIKAKIEYNKTRPHLHGGKLL